MATGFLHDPHFSRDRDFDLFGLFHHQPGACGRKPEYGYRQWLFSVAGFQERPMCRQIIADAAACPA
jgi:hypothetical protein